MSAGMTVEIKCELGCRQVIARAATVEEAEDIATEQGAIYCGGDTGPGEWECGPCRMQRADEGRSHPVPQGAYPFPFHETGDPLTDYLTMKGER
jgi:hypothetical protein